MTNKQLKEICEEGYKKAKPCGFGRIIDFEELEEIARRKISSNKTPLTT